MSKKKFNVLAMTSVVLSLDADDEKAAAHGVLLEIAHGAIQDPSRLNWYIRHVTDKEIDLGEVEFTASETIGGSVEVEGFEKDAPERDWKDVLRVLGGAVYLDGVVRSVRVPDNSITLGGVRDIPVALFKAIVRAACAPPTDTQSTLVIDPTKAS